MARPVLVDTSVWIDFFQGEKTSLVQKLADLLKDDRVCTAGIIRAELLSGTRHEKEYRTLANTLFAVPVLHEPEDLWDRIAHYRFRLAHRGIQASIPDLIIAVLAEHHRCPLLTQDKTFSSFTRVIPFRLQESAS